MFILEKKQDLFEPIKKYWDQVGCKTIDVYDETNKILKENKLMNVYNKYIDNYFVVNNIYNVHLLYNYQHNIYHLHYYYYYYYYLLYYFYFFLYTNVDLVNNQYKMKIYNLNI